MRLWPPRMTCPAAFDPFVSPVEGITAMGGVHRFRHTPQRDVA
jgi:hypothetical protein